MKIYYTLILSIVGLGWCLLSSSICAEEPFNSDKDTFSKLFERRYEAYKNAIATVRKQYSGDTLAQEFQDIIALGPCAVPFIIEKLQNLDLSHNRKQSALLGMLSLITWKRFNKAKWPEGKYADHDLKTQFYIEWFNEDRAKVPEVFAELYARWKQHRSEGNLEKAQEVWNEIKDIGIDVFPSAIENIRLGDAELIPLIPQVLRKIDIEKLEPGAEVLNPEILKKEFDKDAGPKEVLNWWQENKLRFKIPSSKKEAEEIYRKLQERKLAVTKEHTGEVPEKESRQNQNEGTTNQKHYDTKESREMQPNKPHKQPQPLIEQDKSWLVVYLAIAAIVLAGVVIFLLLRRRK